MSPLVEAIEHGVAPEVFVLLQANVTALPDATEEGVTVKEEMVGGVGLTTVTVRSSVTVCAPSFAVKRIL